MNANTGGAEITSFAPLFTHLCGTSFAPSFTHVCGTPPPPFVHTSVCVWQNNAQPNECTVAEVSPGTLLMNMRDTNNENSACHCRLQAFSEDEGETWSNPEYAEDLVEPMCQGSMVADERTVYFANPRSTERRENGVVMRSDDEGQSWQEVTVVDSQDYGYSDIKLVGGEGEGMAVLFESTATCTWAQFKSKLFLGCVLQGWARVPWLDKFVFNEIRFKVVELT